MYPDFTFFNPISIIRYVVTSIKEVTMNLLVVLKEFGGHEITFTKCYLSIYFYFI